MLGARQVGETTLARQLEKEWDGPIRHFDLEDPGDQARLADPAFVLRGLEGLVVLDEIQLRPDIFPLLRVWADRPDCPARFLILGSAAPELLKHTAESLAGRVVFDELDLLIIQEGRRLGFEIKLTRSPQVTSSMRAATKTLGLDHLYVMCHGGGDPWPLAAA